MQHDPDKHRRHSIRLKHYDYASPGMYFITICTQGGELLFGNIVERTMRPNEAGRMIHTVWESLPGRFPNIAMDEFVLMPNHFHGILVIHEHPGPEQDGVPRRAIPQLGDMIGAFKSITTYQYIQGVNCKGWPGFNRQVWQRNYWEHVIRNEAALEEIREYIRNNPARWEEDQLHPDAPPNRFKVWGRPGRQG